MTDTERHIAMLDELYHANVLTKNEWLRARRRIESKGGATRWHPLEAEYLGFDEVATTDGVIRVGRIGPHPDGHWTWVIQATEEATGKQWIDEFGDAHDEAAAKAAVEAWTPDEEE